MPIIISIRLIAIATTYLPEILTITKYSSVGGTTIAYLHIERMWTEAYTGLSLHYRVTEYDRMLI